jgi:hypothetical protein
MNISKKRLAKNIRSLPERRGRPAGQKRRRSRAVSITLEPHLIQLGKKLARAHRRPFSNFLGVLIEQVSIHGMPGQSHLAPTAESFREGVAKQ